MKRLLNYWHALRYLRSEQVYGRLLKKFFQSKPDTRPAPGLRRAEGSWSLPASHNPSMRGSDEFIFLNEKGYLGEIGWTGPERSKLWRYNQHYFNDLNALESRSRYKWHYQLLTEWMKSNPPGYGEGWEPYPTSLRLVNCVKWSMSSKPLPAGLLHSLAIQGRWLSNRLETHILGNHLFANAKALIFLGLFFEGEEADEWMKLGISVLEKEMPEQILKDGGHFELSPMYHSMILEDLLDLINIAQRYPKQIPEELLEKFKECSRRMLIWLDVMSHPDGELAFFNDTAKEIATSLERMREYAVRTNIQGAESNDWRNVYMENSGYFRWESDSAVLIGDIGNIGPDYIPGHAHADTLSFELSIGRQRVLVNSGTSTYEESEERLRQRGTRAHNTVEIDGENSTEVWKSFRVARRAKPVGFQITRDGGEWVQIACSHDGYSRLRGRNIHRRTWSLISKKLTVTDEISGPFNSAVARFRIHPAAIISNASLVFPEDLIIKFESTGGHAKIEKSSWHPEFGLSIPTNCIEIHFTSNKISTVFTWS